VTYPSAGDITPVKNQPVGAAVNTKMET